VGLNLFVLLRAFGAAALFLIVSFVSRNWAPENSDIFVSLIALAAVARIVAPFGLDQMVLHTYPAADCYAHQFRAVLHRKLLATLSLQVALIAPVLIFLKMPIQQAALWVTVWLGSGAVAIGSALLRISNFSILSQFPEAVVTPVIMTLVAIPSLQSPAIASLAIGTGGIGSLVMARNRLTCQCSGTTNTEVLNPSLKPFIPAALAGVTVVLAVKGPILFASHFLGAGASTALDVAARPAMAASLITSALGQYFAPNIAIALKENSTKKITAMCRKAGLMSSVFGLVPLIIIALIGTHGFARIFGSSYADSWKFALLITGAILINSLFSLFSVALTLAGYGLQIALANLLYLTVTGAFGILAATHHSLTLLVYGMAIGSMVRELTVVTIYARRIKSGNFSRIVVG